MWMLSSGTEILDITPGQASQHPAPRPHERTLAQGPEVGARPFRLGWEDTGTQIQDRHQVGSLLPKARLCPAAYTETEGMQAVRSRLPALFAWHWCICAAQAVVPGGQGTGTLFFPTLLIKPTRNRSVCFHLQAIVSAQQIEDFFCIV